MNVEITKVINDFSVDRISVDRKKILQALANYIQLKKDCGQIIRLNFICTHNSRRSHLSQIWAQAMAYYFGVRDVFCYSGGTEATTTYPEVIATLSRQGFLIRKLSDETNPVYAVKYDENEASIICFSKVYNNDFNPQNNFVAIMTCGNADDACPMVIGAETRFSVKYDDPKVFDGTDLQTEKYIERSLEIAQEMWWVFKSIKN